MFVVVYTQFHTFVGMFTNYLHTEFQMTGSNSSSVVTIKGAAGYIFRAAATFFCILKKKMKFLLF